MPVREPSFSPTPAASPSSNGRSRLLIEAELDELIVVCGAAELSEVVPESATLLRNDDWARGQASSLRVAIDWCARQGHLSAVVGLGDLPGLRADAWRTVASARGGPSSLRPTTASVVIR